ncbi:MAG: hypothetical protein EOO11_12945 [Chitinophagaceae bacterium]|nr:MAG: hypothetical protein EOO11_12945 [Chitinophagaceae bacterium]
MSGAGRFVRSGGIAKNETLHFEKRLKRLKRKGYALECILIVEDPEENVACNDGHASCLTPFDGSQENQELLPLPEYSGTPADTENARALEKGAGASGCDRLRSWPIALEYSELGPERQQHASEAWQQHQEQLQLPSERQQHAPERQQHASERQQRASEYQQGASEPRQRAPERHQHASEYRQWPPERRQHASERRQHASERRQHASECQQGAPECRQRPPEYQPHASERQFGRKNVVQAMPFGKTTLD